MKITLPAIPPQQNTGVWAGGREGERSTPCQAGGGVFVCLCVCSATHAPLLLAWHGRLPGSGMPPLSPKGLGTGNKSKAQDRTKAYKYSPLRFKGTWWRCGLNRRSLCCRVRRPSSRKIESTRRSELPSLVPAPVNLAVRKHANARR